MTDDLHIAWCWECGEVGRGGLRTAKTVAIEHYRECDEARVDVFHARTRVIVYLVGGALLAMHGAAWAWNVCLA